MKNLCEILINSGKTDGLKGKMATLMLADMLTQEEFTELCVRLEGEK